jgi:acyl dehydratase
VQEPGGEQHELVISAEAVRRHLNGAGEPAAASTLQAGAIAPDTVLVWELYNFPREKILGYESGPGLMFAGVDWEFCQPVHVGQRLVLSMRVVGRHSKGGREWQKLEMTAIDGEGATVCQIHLLETWRETEAATNEPN